MNIKKVLCASAALLLTAGLLCACADKNDEKNDGLPDMPDLSDLPENYQDVRPEGDITEIWFDETFAVFFPAQLDDIYFTKMYMYGEVQTSQPLIGLCSEKITNIEIFTITDGARGETVYSIDALEPMEAVVISEEFTADAVYGISFSDESGKPHSYALSKNENAQAQLTEF